MLVKNQSRWWSKLAVAAGMLVLLSALVVLAAGNGGAIDGNRARALYQKSQAGQQLTAEEQQYLDRAKQEREKAGGGGRATRSDARAPAGSGENAMDMKRARDLWEKSRRGEKLTPEEQAYLNQATAERQKQGGRAATGQGPLKEPLWLVDYDPVPLPQIKLSAERPRIWFSKQDLPELRKRCQTTHKGYLDAIVERGIQDLGQPGIRAFNLAFAYQMTGEVKYARQAIELAREVKRFGWVKPNERSLPYGEWYAAHADPLACVFDWCCDQLRPDERKTIGGVLREEVAFGPYRTRFHEPFWMASWLSEILALYGAGIDDALAEKALADYNRSIHQWTALADEIHADGAIGTYHYQYKDFFFFPEMWLRATGENLFEKCSFLRCQPMYELYSVMPDHRWLANDGDGPVDPQGTANRNWLYDVKLFAFYGGRNNNPYSRWFARHMQGWPNSQWECPWQAIVWADDGKEEKPLSDLPPVKCFPNNGVVIMREGWDISPESKQILAAFYCRPFEGHAHCNFGDFVIWRGLDRLAKGSHRGYGFQSWRSTNGTPIPTPVVVTAWVYLEKFDAHDWFSLMTLISTPTEGCPNGSIVTLDTSPTLQPVVWCRRKTQDMATPSFHIEQTARPKTKLPLNRWVKLQIYLDWNSVDGAVKVWQDDVLIIDAPKVDLGPKSTLEKGHFGLYCGGNINEITMYNDDLNVATIGPAGAATQATAVKADDSAIA